MDNLSYTYTGNRLMKVADAAVAKQNGNWTQFLNGTNTGNDYAYDADGNLTQDLNKGISSISYNHLNKPTTVSFSNGTQVRYFYSADGTKLRQTVRSFNSTEPPVLAIRQRSDYLGPVHYEDPDGDGSAQRVLLFAQHEEGRIRPSGGEILYEYVLTDHLGNTRITFGDVDADGDPDLLQENHYYPFGLAMTLSGTTAAAPPNDYLYNGKELQACPEPRRRDELGLGWLDYGARMYACPERSRRDASVGRWNGVDALAEAYLRSNPYNYVQNNPISRIDPDGNSCVGCGEGGKDLTPQLVDGLGNVCICATSNGEPNGPDDQATGEYDLGEVVIEEYATRWAKLKSRLKNIFGFGEKTAWTILGAANAFGSDFLLGSGRIDADDSSVPDHVKQAYAIGQLGGDAAAIVVGGIEVGAGTTAEIGSGGIATPIAIPLTLHGAAVTGIASANLANNRLLAKRSRSSDKERSTGTPSWRNGRNPEPGESGSKYAKRLMDEKYGPGNYKTGPGTEFNKLQKYGDRRAK